MPAQCIIAVEDCAGADKLSLIMLIAISDALFATLDTRSVSAVSSVIQIVRFEFRRIISLKQLQRHHHKASPRGKVNIDELIFCKKWTKDKKVQAVQPRDWWFYG
ncbi:hypothetical protein KDD30_08325 [Photobacterium sp. GJ3]|uniref:hypothetical protein n=1 Tax=Photobacterium sp. GJ3 TaxID=2829502 RepID=UPI001B8C1F15|nr:hypothetical protein [Photobacterium sp. GJ3]QUJ66203.1 hypothetical protein KDD30_08325 [Photobacterium sp. GJ3]